MRWKFIFAAMFITACSDKNASTIQRNGGKEYPLKASFYSTGDKCFLDQRLACTIPFQAVFANDRYLGKEIEIRGVLIMQNIYNERTNKHKKYYFLFQDLNQIESCDTESALRLKFDSLPDVGQEYEVYNGSRVLVFGTLHEREDNTWRVIKVEGMSEIAMNIVPKNLQGCMRGYVEIPPHKE